MTLKVVLSKVSFVCPFYCSGESSFLIFNSRDSRSQRLSDKRFASRILVFNENFFVLSCPVEVAFE